MEAEIYLLISSIYAVCFSGHVSFWFHFQPLGMGACIWQEIQFFLKNLIPSVGGLGSSKDIFSSFHLTCLLSNFPPCLVNAIYANDTLLVGWGPLLSSNF